MPSKRVYVFRALKMHFNATRSRKTYADPPLYMDVGKSIKIPLHFLCMTEVGRRGGVGGK